MALPYAFIPVGKKIADELHKAGYQTDNSFLQAGDKLNYEDASQLATAMMTLYTSGQADRVELLYHHFKNMAEQILTEKVFLPITLPEITPTSMSANYILEPSSEHLLALLLPKVLHLHTTRHCSTIRLPNMPLVCWLCRPPTTMPTT